MRPGAGPFRQCMMMTSATATSSLDIVLFISRYGAGGVERMLINTARALAERELGVAMVLTSAEGPYLDELPPATRRIVIEGDPVAGLGRVLAEHEPAVAISAKLDDDRILADARDRAEARTRILFRVGNPLGHRLSARRLNPLGRWLKLRELRRLYRRADGFIAVSHGIKSDLQRWLALPAERIRVLPNPVITPEFHQRASRDPGHRWLQPDAPPVILGVGGLRSQKDFATLLRAFARVRCKRACRLIILGEGRQRRRLRKLAGRLGVDQDFDLPGWSAESHAYMARAAVFALSSRWEGTANVIIEAAALGTPIVATDCRYGPREVLQDGRYGELVPPRDPDALAAGLLRMLDHPPAKEMIRRAATPYHMAQAGRLYAEALGFVISGKREGTRR